MVVDEEAAGTRCPATEIKPEKFRLQYKADKMFMVGEGEGKLGSVGFPETTRFFRPN